MLFRFTMPLVFDDYYLLADAFDAAAAIFADAIMIFAVFAD